MKRGVVYISRIPHGFYEEEMKEYFGQFEFLSEEVAQIVAETMNNYIMYNRLLKCELVPQEKINPFMWIGANKEFKPKSYLKEAMQVHNRKKRSLEEKKKRNMSLLKREKIKRKKLEKLGFEYEFPGYVNSSKKRVRNEKVKDKGKNKKVKLEKDSTEKEFEKMDREMKKMDVEKEKSGKEKLENVKEKMGKRKKRKQLK
ncbi:1380_t:CDS:2 [Diversispora eburnea]|uniref:1380_t:CDS:1 n=1 Tax=Diversispora eburnea TaxID=1213867 RepID=A0A9N9C5J3_9GLOM|nr:1380_t:CDS:2 [Diversispora eburnea]